MDLHIGKSVVYDGEVVVITEIFQVFGDSPSGNVLVEGEDGIPVLVNSNELEEY
jgi:hypothetical protein